MEQQAITTSVPGGGFLVSPLPRSGVFTREDLSEEQVAFGEAARAFTEGEILPNIDKIEGWAEVDVDGKQVPFQIDLLQRAIEQGFASIEIPEEYEGLGLDLTTDMVVCENMYGCASFAVTIGAHCGIGTLPISYFGSHEQKQKYLPKLSTGELISCYALTEPGNGSDALHGRTTAVLSEDGSHYVLNGQKQFISNGSWADIAVVFANIDGKYSGLIVDLHSEGVERGAEEKKMGIHGSSTTGLVFQDVKVPAENLLGKVGDAAKIALNILYVGRMKLGFATMGTAKYAIDLTVKFTNERKQFGRAVAEFDLQQGKLAEMVAWTYGCDSACYRIVGEVDQRIARLPEQHTTADEIAILRQFGLECAIVKVHGSETLSRVLYHAVRMHGGYGFCQEYIVERLARDNVIDTIYEGTNDINRIVAYGALIESAYMGSIPFLSFMDQLHTDLARGAYDAETAPEAYLGQEELRITRLKRAVAYTAEQVLISVGKNAKVEQQVCVSLADLLIHLYVAESALCRTIQVGAEHPQAAIRADICRLLIREAEDITERLTRDALEYTVPAVELSERLEAVRRLLPRVPDRVVELKRRIAEHVNAAGRYDL